LLKSVPVSQLLNPDHLKLYGGNAYGDVK
jgi:hypothetical protein